MYDSLYKWYSRENKVQKKCRINMGTTCYFSDEKLCCPIFFQIKVKIRIKATKQLPESVIQYSCETCSHLKIGVHVKDVWK